MKPRIDGMWLHVAFDLPTLTAEQRKAASGFRDALTRRGFSRSQLSIYVMYVPRQTHAETIISHVLLAIPPGGKVCILRLTDHQWSQADRFCADEVQEDPEQPDQLEFF